MNKRGAFGLIILGASLALLSTQAFAQSSIHIKLVAGYHKGNGRYSLVVKDTPNTKLELYVNDKNPTLATVNKHNWATFNSVRLIDTGKLSFTKVLQGKHGTYQQPVAYTERYTVSKNKVIFSNYITDSTVATIKSIPFTTSTEQDNSLAKGTTQIKTTGVNGSEKLTYQLVWTDAKVTSRTLVSTTLVTPVVNEVIEDGTYVASTPTVKTSTPSATPTSSSTSASSCYPLSDEGTCYEPGEYCRSSDQGTTGVAGDGEAITCEDNDGLRWEPN